jgi:hypothetical protein
VILMSIEGAIIGAIVGALFVFVLTKIFNRK